MCVLLGFLQKTWAIPIMNPLMWFMIDSWNRNKFDLYSNDTEYRITSNFRKVFIFGYFKKPFFCKNKFQRSILPLKINSHNQ